MPKIESVLVANRGEIACRIIRTLRAQGIRSIAVYSDADAGARHVALADESVRLGTANAADSYLNAGKVIAAAVLTGANAIHPGYGFLAENAEFAAACTHAGLVFIGPSAEAIDTMGDKIRAKAHVAERGVPVVPGVARPGLTDEDLIAAVLQVGFPALIKPSAGGGGKGMHVVEREEDVAAAVASARREAASSFGDDTLFVERYLQQPRHIEVQVLADQHGTVIHLGERECSLQRRHQKVIEEAPSALLDPATRERIGLSACETARSVGYAGAGTVEFIISADAPTEYFFMEMNTRLQVEHPVTEMVTGVDIVDWQVRIAAGEPLTITQDDVVLTGHAVEARIYAEDPPNGFLPTGGTVEAYVEPGGDAIRVDSAIIPGLQVSSDYDPMMAKVIAWAPDRRRAIERLDAALGRTAVVGVVNNIPFLRRLLQDVDVLAGDLDTGLIARRLDALVHVPDDPDDLVKAALLSWAADRVQPVNGPWASLSGWRIGRPAASRYRYRPADGDTREVAITRTDGVLSVRVDDGPARTASVVLTGPSARIRLGAVSAPVTAFVRSGDRVEFVERGVRRQLVEHRRDIGGADDAQSEPELRSPMPGTVVAIVAADGASVEAGDPVIVIEAMKMEHVLRAPVPGRVRLTVAVGASVAANQAVVTIEPSADAGPAAESKERDE